MDCLHNLYWASVLPYTFSDIRTSWLSLTWTKSALCIAHSPVRVTMLTETFHVHFCLVSQCPSSYLHHIFGTSLIEAICGQSSCDIGCLYGTMYARQCLPNHLNYSVDCHCTLDWLGMESSYYCTCGGTINLFRC